MKKTIIALLLIALTLAQNSIFEKHQKEKNFLNYSKKNGKKYANLEESLYRFSVYKDNIKTIEELNKENQNATFEENIFTDLTDEELIATYGGIKTPAEIEERKLDSESKKSNLGPYPDSLDLRTQAGMQPIRYQGGCGSCWAFSTISTLEYAYWKKTGISSDLSEQQLVDCVYGSKGGCQGGWMPTAYDYIKKVPGLALEQDYKYTHKNGICNAASIQNQMPIVMNNTKSYQKVTQTDEAIKSAIANVGVLSVCVYAQSWGSYKSGVYMNPKFNDQTVNPSCNHAVSLVGYGTENDIPYYIIRNSWGVKWGDKGYMKMDARRHPNGNLFSGLMLKQAYYPILQ